MGNQPNMLVWGYKTSKINQDPQIMDISVSEFGIFHKFKHHTWKKLDSPGETMDFFRLKQHHNGMEGT